MKAKVLLSFATLVFVCALGAGVSRAPAAARLPALSISPPASIPEGDQGTTVASFKVKLSAPTRRMVSVRYRTDGFLATEGADFRVARGTLVFKPGQRTKRVVVQIVGDTVPEDVEDFYVILSKPRNAGLRVAQATGKIAASDLPAPFSVAADLKAGEGPGTGHALITLDAVKGEATFTLEVRSSPRDPTGAHIHSRTTALGGSYPSLQPLPSRDGTVSGTIQVPPRTILMMDANLADFLVEVHVGPALNSPGDLSGDLRRVP